MFISILNLALAAPIDLIPQNLQCIQVIKLFGVPPVFVMKFLGEICLIFIVSALISYALKINKASNE